MHVVCLSYLDNFLFLQTQRFPRVYWLSSDISPLSLLTYLNVHLSMLWTPHLLSTICSSHRLCKRVYEVLDTAVTNPMIAVDAILLSIASSSGHKVLISTPEREVYSGCVIRWILSQPEVKEDMARRDMKMMQELSSQYYPICRIYLQSLVHHCNYPEKVSTELNGSQPVEGYANFFSSDFRLISTNYGIINRILWEWEFWEFRLQLVPYFYGDRRSSCNILI